VSAEITWRRKSDGVLFTTRAKNTTDMSHSSVLVERADGTRCHWATWEGLFRKYEKVSEQ
jgi:hypothetical protein